MRSLSLARCAQRTATRNAKSTCLAWTSRQPRSALTLPHPRRKLQAGTEPYDAARRLAESLTVDHAAALERVVQQTFAFHRKNESCRR